MTKDKKDKKTPEEEPKGFKVDDKRKLGKERPDEPTETKKTDTPTELPHDEEKKETADHEGELPPIDFPSFIMSLSTSALIYLGEITDPLSKETKKDLPAAKQTIDLIGLLKEKTHGNLNEREEEFMESILYDLRMRFVKAQQ
jgi:hypothetical protein